MKRSKRANLLNILIPSENTDALEDLFV